MKKLFRGGWVVDGEGKSRRDLLVEGEKIIRVEADITDADAEVIDVTGKLLFPGFIDPHTHFDLEVAGTVTVDDFASGTRAAVAGGTTVILDFATQNHGETLDIAWNNWNRKAVGKCYCDYGFHMAISQWNEDISKEIDVMIDRGITSFKLYMTYDGMYLDDGDIYRALCRMKETGGLAGVHCENRDLIAALTAAEKAAGHLSPLSHPLTRPPQAEAEAVNRLLEIASLVDVPVMIVHLSTERGLQVVKAARKRGQTVFAETCPQYLLMTDEKYHLPGFTGGRYVIAPPLRQRQDNESLWAALAEEEIQTIGTDHCSFTLKQKEMGKDDFTKIPGGMAGVENRPALIYTYGVRNGKITEAQMCRCLSEQPARLYGMYPVKGALKSGSDADIVVWNPQVCRTLSREKQLAAVDYHAYEGTEVWGLAEQVYLRGTLAAENETSVYSQSGRYISRDRKMAVDRESL